MKLKNIVFTGVMCAVAIVLMLAIRINMFGFLTYDPKDVAVVMLGFILGPLYSLLASVIVATIELITISDTGLIGFFMNIVAGVSYATTAAICYKKLHTKKGAVISLLSGTAIMTVFMVLWNYIVTPFYMNLPREEVAGLLIPVFVPFNMIKGIINSAVVMVIYKPIVKALRNTKLI